MLDANKIENICGLEKLVNLEILSLNNNKIKKIGDGLSKNRKLRILGLKSNQLSEIEGLNAQYSLEILYLCNNQLSDVACLTHIGMRLPGLKELTLAGNELYSDTE